MIDRALFGKKFPLLDDSDSIDVLSIALLGDMEYTCICNVVKALDGYVGLDLEREIQSPPGGIAAPC